MRLVYEFQLSQRKTAQAVGISRFAVRDYLARAEAAGLSWPLPFGLSDTALEAKLFEQSVASDAQSRPLPDWKAVRRELAQKGVTRMLLWEEYTDGKENPYSYSRFCELYRAWAAKLEPTMRLDHKAGERVYVDYAGQTMPYIDAETGELREASIFVAALGASSYTYAEAQVSEDLVHWLGAHVRAFEYLGGVPRIVVPDNVKTGVTSPCRYEPDVNRSYHDLAVHYHVAVLPTRVATPRDKAKAESGVQVVERWLIAPLRKQMIVGIDALNAALRERLEWLNNRVMKHLGKSRRELFEAIDRPALQPLPPTRFDFALWKSAKVHIDYHFQFDYHYYSVPCELIHETVEARATARTVEAFHNGVRVVAHARSYVRGGHTTLPEHMPKNHRQYAEWTPERIARWAAEVGPDTAQLALEVMEAREHPEQGFRSCLGILRLGTSYSNERLEAAARRALAHGVVSYKGVKRILDGGLDHLDPDPEPDLSSPQPHDNLRGSAYYAKEADDALAADLG